MTIGIWRWWICEVIMGVQWSKIKAGRSWKVDGKGIPSLKRIYIVKLDDVLAVDGEIRSFAGVPTVGSPHPMFPYLRVKDYDVEEGKRGDKIVLLVTVNYEVSIVVSEGVDPEDPDSEAFDCEVERWGWDDGTEQKELTTAVDGTAVLNSAGDPFDRVPTVGVWAPTFVKIFKTEERKNYLKHNCKVNNVAITISGISFPAGTLLCSVAEEMLIGEEKWKFKYTVNLKYRTNLVALGNGGNPVECGWDATVVDTGMREWRDDMKRVVVATDFETGRPCKVSSPALLDGSGHAQVQATQQDQVYPYVFRFKAYERTYIPKSFFSEPIIDDESEPN